MFTYMKENSAVGMRATWEKFVHHIGIDISQDISTELWTRIMMVIPDPVHSQYILYRQLRQIQLHYTTHTSLREARDKILESLAEDISINNLYALLKTSDLQNEI